MICGFPPTILITADRVRAVEETDVGLVLTPASLLIVMSSVHALVPQRSGLPDIAIAYILAGMYGNNRAHERVKY